MERTHETIDCIEDASLFNEWFNVKSRDHMSAYQHLIKHGEWPKHFIPADISFERDWQTKLNQRIVTAYIDSMTGPAYRGRVSEPWK